MLDPKLALLAAAGICVLAVLLLRPRQGWVWRWRRALLAGGRMRIEDALKHLYDCEYRGLPATLHSLSGFLGLTGNRAAELLQRLEDRELIEPVREGYHLTPAGRSYALRVIRIHRLWERYFSDRTGLDAAHWHAEADAREHLTTEAEAEALAAAMGHPRFDPHGDPIPTAGGDLPRPRARPLTDLPAGELAEIVHVEDEPEAVYAQLRDRRLVPGMRVRVEEASPTAVRFQADGEEHSIAPVVAANLSVAPLPQDEEMVGPFDLLADLVPGEEGQVVALAPACRGAERRRLLDLGVLPGTVITAELRSPAGDPTAYRIRGAVIALRREQAAQVRIQRLGEAP